MQNAVYHSQFIRHGEKTKEIQSDWIIADIV